MYVHWCTWHCQPWQEQSAKAEKSQHLILVTTTTIWCGTVMAKWVTIILTITKVPKYLPF